MTFTLFGLTGYWYGLTVGISALAYLCVAGVLGYRRRLPSGTLRLFGLLALPLGLLFARLVFCIARFAYFFDDISQPLRMFSFWDGGYSLVGVFCGLILAAFLTARIQKIRFGVLFDVTAAPIGALVFGLRLAEGFTALPGKLGQLGVGRQVDAGVLSQTMSWLFLEDKMGTLTLYRLAVYRIEAIVALFVLALTLILFFNRRHKRRARPGDLAMIAYSLFAVSQILMESLRDDAHMLMGFIRFEQVCFAMIPLLALLIFGARYAHIREAKKATIAAWLLLPIAALVLLLMIHPLNHVLDLTEKRGLGLGILAALGGYMALFLRVKGADVRLTVTWLVALLAVAGCVMVEFSVDGSDNLIRDYAVMSACCAALFLAPCTLWQTLKERVYREESISVHISSVQ